MLIQRVTHGNEKLSQQVQTRPARATGRQRLLTQAPRLYSALPVRQRRSSQVFRADGRRLL